MVKQLSIFLQNESGRIADIAKTLADAQINIRALNIADTPDFGILRMLVSDVDAAVKALSAKGYVAKATPVTVVAVPDEVGGLATVLSIMAEGGIDLEYMYSYLGRSMKHAYMIFRSGDETALAKLLTEHGIVVADKEDLHLK